MTWFFVALIAPFLWSIVNYIDKYLLSNQFKGRSIGVLMIFSTLISIFVLPILYFIEPSVLNIGFKNALLLIGVGLLSAVAILFYLYALNESETSMVISIFQTVPVFGFVFAYIMLGEILSHNQIMGCLLILIGSIIITLEFDEESNTKFKKRIFLLMLASSMIFGFYETLFKVAAIKENFWVASFWEHIGLFIFGMALLFFGSHRQHFLALIKSKNFNIFSLNIGSEIITIIGNMITNYVILLAPIALVLIVSGTQPLIVFMIGIFLTLFFPKIAKEKITTKHLIHKFFSIAVIFLGVIMIQ